MDGPIVAAVITGWATIVGGLMSLHRRTNGSGPLAGELKQVHCEIAELRRTMVRHLESHGRERN